MNIRFFISIFIIYFFSLLISANEQDIKPNLISPGESGIITIVEQSCPTFSWTSVPWATEYKIVVFRSGSELLLSYEEMAASGSPIINKDIKGRATSWTPSSIQRMKTGINYIWYVKAIDQDGTGEWSQGGRYRVKIPLTLSGIEETLRKKLEDKDVAIETIDEVFNDIKQEIKEVVVIDKDKSKTGTVPDGTLGYEDANNTLYGIYAGNFTQTGTGNSFFGVYAGNSNSSGYSNTFVGDSAGRTNTSGTDNAFFGKGSGYSNYNGAWNTFSGFESGYTNLGGYSNTFTGYKAGHQNSGGNYNTFIGSESGQFNSSGMNNTFLGSLAGRDNRTGSNNTFVGMQAGLNNIWSGNVFIGYKAGYNEEGANKLYIENSDSSTPLIYGEFNNNIVTINGKLGIGTKTPVFPLEIHTTGSNAKIVINRTDGATGHMLAKANFCTFGTASNHPLRLNVNNIPKIFLLPNGNVGIGVETPLHPLHLASGAHCTLSGVWQNASSRDFKENIVSINSSDAFETLKGLEPVTYNYKLEKNEIYAGFIAEDVPEMVASKGRKSLGTMDIVAVLTKVTKEQQKIIEEQQKSIEKMKTDQEKIIIELIKRINKLEKE